MGAAQQDLYRWHSENFRAVSTGFERTCSILTLALGDRDEVAVDALTRVATFLLSAKVESRFYKLLYEPPVPDEFRALVNAKAGRAPSLIDKWKRTVEIAFCEYNHVNRPFQDSVAPLDSKRQHDVHLSGIKHLESIIGLRNKVAHGQWRVALNTSGTDLNAGITARLSAENLMSLQLKDRLAASVANAVNDLVVSSKTHHRDLGVHRSATEDAIRELETRSWEKYVANVVNRADIRRERAKAVRTRLKRLQADGQSKADV
ncbi:MAG: hypothetical protein JHC95_08345 [Solirubrobacteraceae bacterium]|nr:hypothetical protein [Solirubrobacteraceae bacterium]